MSIDLFCKELKKVFKSNLDWYIVFYPDSISLDKLTELIPWMIKPSNKDDIAEFQGGYGYSSIGVRCTEEDVWKSLNTLAGRIPIFVVRDWNDRDIPVSHLLRETLAIYRRTFCK